MKRKREELIKKLQESIRQNEELTREKQNIMQTITHELRSPLSAIRGYAEMIVTDEERSSRIRHAKTIGDASRRMAEMIDTLLNYFRLDSGKETVRSLPFRLKSIADTLETEFMPQMEKKRLAFETVNEADEVVIGDRSLILRIGSNLLSNALKFTQKGAVKLITGYSDGNFILTVDDTGTGIDKEKQDRIFKPFERLGQCRHAGRLWVGTRHCKKPCGTDGRQHHGGKRSGKRQPVHRHTAAGKGDRNRKTTIFLYLNTPSFRLFRAFHRQ